MAANYYLVLGVTPDANLSQIKRAFRQLSHQHHHPDHADDQGQQAFLLARDAYDILSDPTERERYNRELSAQRPTPPRPRPVASSPIDLFGSFGSFSPSPDEILDTFMRNFTGRHLPKATRPRDLNVEIVLTQDEAAAGGSLPLRIPTFHPCPTCAGTGRTGYYACDDCDGHGMLAEAHQVDVLIPRNTPDGTIIPVSLAHLGIRNLYLNVHVRVARTASAFA